MTRGNRRRRTARGFAPIMLAALVVVVVSGCRNFPAPDPSTTPANAHSSAPVDPAPLVEQAAPPSVPVSPIPIAEPPREAEPPMPTPMLDAALERAEAINREVAREIARPDPEPLRTPDASPPAEPVTRPPVDPPTIATPIADAAPLDAEPAPREASEVAIPVVANAQGADTSPPSTAAPEPTVLAINALRTCRRVLGFGNVEPSDGSECRPGRAILLYCEASGLRYVPVGDHFRSRLASTIDLIPEAGGDPAWTQAFGAAEDPCARPRRDYFVGYLLPLPKALPPGNYRLRLTLKDLADGSTATESTAIVVRP